MVKKSKTTKISKILFSFISLILGVILGGFINIYLSLPDSYKIPEKIKGTSFSEISTVSEDVDVIKNNDLSIHFLELGNKYTGDCIYIKVGSTDILVDGGSKIDSVPYITEYVDKYCTDGILDFVIITHAHEDHYAGYATNDKTESLFDHYTKDERTIGTIIKFSKTTATKQNQKMYQNFENELSEAVVDGAKTFTALECYNNENVVGIGKAQREYDLVQESDKETIDENIKLQILYTKYYEEVSETENNHSVCFQIVQGDNKYLFTGDLEEDGEESLVENNELSHVVLYKAGHHGSKTSSSMTLLNAITPDKVVVCCCAGSSEYTSKNENQFPTQTFITNIFSCNPNVEVYVTSLCVDYQSGTFEPFNGTIVFCYSDETNLKTYCSNNTTLLNDTEWFKNNRTLPNS